MSITCKKRRYREVHDQGDHTEYITRPTKRRSPMTFLLDVVARIKTEEEKARKQHELDKLVDEWAKLVKADHAALMYTHEANVGFAARVETIFGRTTVSSSSFPNGACHVPTNRQGNMKPTMSITRKKRSYREVHDERDDAKYIAEPTKRRSPMTVLLDTVGRIKTEEENVRKQHELDKLVDEWAQLVKADSGALTYTHKANMGFAARVETVLGRTTIEEDGHSSSSEWVDDFREEGVRLFYPRSDGVLTARLSCLSGH